MPSTCRNSTTFIFLVIALPVWLFIFVTGKELSAGNPLKEKSLFVTVYGIEEGLNQSMVSRVMQDSRGLIWMVTGDGLQCFDGNTFRSFRVPDQIGGLFSDNTMREIVEYEPGRFVVSTSTSLLDFNSASGQFTMIVSSPGYYPRVLSPLYRGKPLVWTPDLNLACIDHNRLIPFKLDFDQGAGFPRGFFPRDAVETASGELILDGDQGLLVVGRIMPGTADVHQSVWKPLPEGCQGLTKDKSGQIYVLSGGMIFRWLEGGTLKPFCPARRIESGSMFADRNGNFWISDKPDKSIFFSDRKQLSGIKLLNREGKHIDTIHSQVICFYEDKQGNIWLGTDGDGLLCYSPGQVQFGNARTGFTRCLTSRNGYLWAGTFRNGLWKLSEDFSLIREIRNTRLPGNLYYLDLTFDRHSRLWIASDQGLYVIDTLGNVLFHRANSQNAACFLPTGSDTILLASGGRLERYDSKSAPGFIDSNIFTTVRAFLLVNGFYWLGTPYGLYRFSVSTKWDGFKVINPGNRVSIRPLFALLYADGCIWTASERGVERFNLEGKKLPDPAVVDELRNEVVYALIADDYNRIWLSCNKGIGCITADRKRIIWFNLRNNLQSLEFNNHAYYKSPGGRIFFGGINGINGIDPRDFHPGKSVTEVQLISLSVSDAAFSGGIPPGDLNLQISWRSPHLSGRVFTDDYLNPEMQLFSFLLEGYQDAWSAGSPNPEFSYRNLPPGKYRLMVKCTDAFRNASEAKCLLSFTIKPPFWKTWWFKAGMTLIIVGITILAVRKVNKDRFTRKLHELEKQNAVNRERLRIAKDMHDEVGASLTRISIMSELARKRNDDPQESMKIISRISEISGDVVDEMSEIIWAMNPKNDTLDSFAGYLRRYASDYLESAGIEGKFHFPYEIPAAHMSAEWRRNIFLTAKEALHNIVKHSGADHVEIILAYADKLLELTIRDNGKGFNTEERTGTGNGLINMQKRIREPGGQYTLVSGPGSGTEIRLSVRLG